MNSERADTYVVGDDTPHPAAPPQAAAPTDPLAKVYKLHDEPTDAIVVCCADPRFLSAIDDFLEDLGVRNPAIIAVPGSVKAVSLNVAFLKDWHTLRNQLKLMAERNAHVPKVILFTHQDCKSYEHSARLFGGLPKIPLVQRDHLVKLAGILQKEYLPSAKFELYHATIVPNGTNRGVKFVRVVGGEK